MPTVKRVCSHLGCRNLVERGAYCAEHARSAREASEAMYRRQRGPDERGRQAWRRFSQWFLALHPICQRCGRRTATSVHHVTPYREGGLWGGEFLALCRKCHAKAEAELKK